ncbi:MAG: lysophospholipid acyltransferase family protein, partial [Chromatocurvus sp.]
MAQYYLIPKSLAERLPALGRLAQQIEARFFQALFWFVQRLSPERATRVARALFGRFGPRSEKARKADANLAVAFPERDANWRRETVREIFRSLGESAAELIKLEQIWQERDQRIRFSIDPATQAVIDRGQPIVFVCAHVGAWQLTNLIARHANLTISTVIAPESNPLIHRSIQRLRTAFGVGLIPTDAGVRPLIRELKAGHCIGLATDTRLNTGTLLPFFGRDALTNTTAARLALSTGAALVPIHCERLGDARFHVRVLPPLWGQVPSG